jgi:general secretion pathway protein L
MRLPFEMRAQLLLSLSKQLPGHWRGSVAQGAWQWWTAQLRSCLPRHWLHDTPEQCYPWPIQGIPVHRGLNQRAVLLLRPDQVLQHTLTLPLTAGRDLDKLLSYELDRFTPFQPEQVHHVVRREGVAAGRLSATLVLVRRDHLAVWVADYAEHAVTFDRVDVMDSHGEPQGLNLLPMDAVSSMRRGGRSIAAWLLLIAVSAGVIMTLTLQRQQSAVQQRVAEVQALRAQVAELQSMRQTLAQTGSTARQLTLLKQGQATTAQLLAELSRCLPVDSWLQSLQVNKEGQVDLAGLSAHASSLIIQMKSCPSLVDVRYQGIIQPDTASGKDRFYIRAQLRRGPDHAVYADSP